MGVDPGLYEAAQLDGASSTTMFWRITIPLIRPLLVYHADHQSHRRPADV